MSNFELQLNWIRREADMLNNLAKGILDIIDKDDTWLLWRDMINQCKPGGKLRNKGYYVSSRWNNYDWFIEDIGNKPSEFCTLVINKEDKEINKDTCQWWAGPMNSPLINREASAFRVKLDEDAVRDIRKKKESGWGFQDLANKYDVSTDTVRRVVARTRWRNIK